MARKCIDRVIFNISFRLFDRVKNQSADRTACSPAMQPMHFLFWFPSFLRACDNTHTIHTSTARGTPRLPPVCDPAGLFSEDGELMKLYVEGSLMIPKPGIKRV